ncbi:MAG: hypothetical protein PF572_04400 [Patescibacteria group bacterium]|jgi:hypothetical protein|nr:hypothetical protein [Patescibacteria group bacterium]
MQKTRLDPKYLLCFISINANAVYQGDMFADYETIWYYQNLIENETTNVDVTAFVYTSTISQVRFAPNTIGTWKLSLTGTNPFWYALPSGAVEVAWKDSQGDDLWHVFTVENVLYGVFTNITLNSGSASISYRIRLANQADVPGYISATPLFLHAKTSYEKENQKKLNSRIFILVFWSYKHF